MQNRSAPAEGGEKKDWGSWSFSQAMKGTSALVHRGSGLAIDF